MSDHFFCTNFPDRMFAKAFDPPKKSMLSVDSLNYKIECAMEALEMMSLDVGQSTHHLRRLHYFFEQKYSATGDAADLDDFIEYTRAFVDLIPRDRAYRAVRLNGLGVCLEERYRMKGGTDDLQEAIDVIQEAVDMVQEEEGQRINLEVQVRNLHDLGILFGRKYSTTGAATDIDKAIESLNEAVRIAVRIEDNCVRKAICLMSLSHRHAEKYYRGGNLECLEDSIHLMVQVAALVPDSYNNAVYLYYLAFRLADRYMLTGSTATLDTAISLAKKAIDLTPEPCSDRALFLNTYAKALGVRSMRSDTKSGLDEAIQAAEEAVALTPEGHPNRVGYLSCLRFWQGYRN